MSLSLEELLARAVCLYADDECVSVETVMRMLVTDENFRPQELEEARAAVAARAA